jgi:predicted glycosyltransferase
MFELHAPNHETKAMFYSHDTFGLGHLRRTLTLANHFRAAVPALSQLIVTGSPVASRFRLPQDTDFIKLPSVTKNASGDYEPRSLAGSFASVRDMRQDILFSAARHFQPDYFIVDHAPAGMRGEAVAALRHLKRHQPETKLIVGLRDIMDDARTVRQAWSKEGVYELFDDIYDMIVVYGNRNFYDVVSEYGLSPKAAAKTQFVGYLGREPGRRSPEEVRAGLGMQTNKLLVVTAGGGGDGRNLYDAMLRDLQIGTVDDFDCLIVGGPLLAERDRADLLARAGQRGNIHFLDFTDDLPSYLGAADAVISMGGYNAVCEILSLNRPSIIVPRTHPQQEQLIRATVLSGHGLVEMIHPGDLAPARLLDSARELLAKPEADRPRLPMDGLPNVVNALGSLRSLPV